MSFRNESQEMFTRMYLQQLEREYTEISWYYKVKLTKAHIVIDDASRCWGYWDPNLRVIGIARRLILEKPWDVVVEVLKHEMAHQIVSEVFRVADHGHGPLFKKACNVLRVSSWASMSEIEVDEKLLTWRDDSYSAQDTEALRLLRRVEKLLHLAQSSNEHESYLAMQTVRELYRKHNVKTFQTQADRQFVHAVLNLGRKVVSQADTMISVILRSHFFVRTITVGYFDVAQKRQTKALEILGTKENVLMAEYVFHYLRRSTEQLWRTFKKQYDAPGSSKRSYILGVLTGFDEKLTDTRMENKATQAGVPSSDADVALPILVQQNIMLGMKRELESFLQERYPRTRMRSWSSSSGDAESYYAGQEEGRRLTISKAITHTASGVTKLLTS